MLAKSGLLLRILGCNDTDFYGGLEDCRVNTAGDYFRLLPLTHQ